MVGAGASGSFGGEGFVGFLPKFFLNFVYPSSRRLAGLHEDQLYTCVRGAPEANVPSLTSTLDLEGLDMTGKGPSYFSDSDFWSPWFLTKT